MQAQKVLRKPYLLFLGDDTSAPYAKTAYGMRDWAPEACLEDRFVIREEEEDSYTLRFLRQGGNVVGFVVAAPGVFGIEFTRRTHQVSAYGIWNHPLFHSQPVENSITPRTGKLRG